ncbi:glycerol-3-phosphate 1-O-acyltransferase PlsY [Lacticaseibacillus zhaodongensis]|uniref:glycerol-3-phosphate 1-O-acyltransferase PlsY n=1 Tax=Lacticaseibacillus zhaodongensis TaxID=2668065 RepID=UPI0012D2E8FB|nr:glycerol-3-phosphate 1-O-acyltransferase PlsY [Lacticaseibacillus zhaodongensis]
MLLAISFVLAYLIGSIPSGVWIGRIFCHKDPRDAGSHNIGTTNAYRVLGPTAGTEVLILDILKGTLGASLPRIFGYSQHWLILVCGLAAVAGHVASIFLHFKGGKAVATSAGILLAYNPGMFLLASSIFVGTILVTSTVSIASILGVFAMALVALLIHDWVLAVIAAALTVFFVWRHLPNLIRIREGKENIVHFGLYYSWLKHHRKSN